MTRALAVLVGSSAILLWSLLALLTVGSASDDAGFITGSTVSANGGQFVV